MNLESSQKNYFESGTNGDSHEPHGFENFFNYFLPEDISNIVSHPLLYPSVVHLIGLMHLERAYIVEYFMKDLKPD